MARRTLRAGIALAIGMPGLLMSACESDAQRDNRSAIADRPAAPDDASFASLNPELFTSSSDSRPDLRVRRNVRSLTKAERKDYVSAVLKLKATKSPYDPSLSYYDQFVVWHIALNLCEFGQPLPMQMGHGSPIFLPWHRVFTLLFETALRQVSDKDIAVPYWDWASTPDHDMSVVFADDFMGGAGDPMDNYAVKSGPFRKGKWTLTVEPPGTRWAPYVTTYLTRFLRDTPFPLPTPADVDLAMSTTVYDVPPYDHTSPYGESFRNTLEGNRGDGPPLDFTCTEDGTMPIPINGSALHNGIHAWVGGPFNNGTMVLPTSPNDPVFFLHHAQIDRLWAQWQEAHGVDSYEPAADFPDIDAHAIMRPFDGSGIRVTPAQVADTTNLGYRYQ